LAERQQGFQNQQQQEAWRRAMEQFTAGNTSNPYGARMDASGMYGAGADRALDALGQYWRSLGQNAPTTNAPATPPWGG
jgi:hypothetical protein